MTRLTHEEIESLRTKTVMNRMSEGPAERSHRTNHEVLALFTEIDALRSELKEKDARIAEMKSEPRPVLNLLSDQREEIAQLFKERDELQAYANGLRDVLKSISEPCPIIEDTPTDRIMEDSDTLFGSTIRRRDIARKALQTPIPDFLKSQKEREK